MANGRSQRVDTVTTGDENVRHVLLRPAAEAVRRRRLVLVRRRRRPTRTSSSAPAEWTAEVPADRAAARHRRHLHHHDEPPGLLREAARPARRRTRSSAPTSTRSSSWSRARRRCVDSEFFPEAEKALGTPCGCIEQGNLGGSGGYARGQLRVGPQGHGDLRDDAWTTTSSASPRASSARSPSATSPAGPPSWAATCSASSPAPACTASARSSARGASGGASAPGVFSDWDFGARNLRSTRWLHKRIDVDFNGWFMCLIPRQVLDEIGLSLPLFIKWDDSEFGLRAKEAGYPTVSLPRRGRVAHPVDRQERRPGLAVLLPPAQPVRRRAAALGVRAWRPDGPREPQPPDQAPGLDAVLHRRAAARGARGRARRAPRVLHDAAAHASWPRSSVRKQFTDAQLEADPRRLPAGAPAQAAAQGQGRPRRAEHAAARFARGDDAAASAEEAARASRQHPEAEIPAMDAKWYRIARYDSAVVSMPDGNVRGALPARPGEVPRPDEADHRDPPPLPAGSGRAWPRSTARRWAT